MNNPMFCVIQLSPLSTVSPKTLNKRPNVSFPYRYRNSLSCCCHFHIFAKSVTGCQHNTSHCMISYMLGNLHNDFFSVQPTVRASLIFGRSCSWNSTSTTGPNSVQFFLYSLYKNLLPLLFLFLCFCTADYLSNFLCNCSLSDTIIFN